MTPNPYQSPQHAGYGAPKPGRLPLWRRLVRIALVVMLLAYFGFAAVVFFLWYLGF